MTATRRTRSLRTPPTGNSQTARTDLIHFDPYNVRERKPYVGYSNPMARRLRASVHGHGLTMSSDHSNKKIALRTLPRLWEGYAVHTECTLHQISPYIGKLKSSMAHALVSAFSKPGDYVYDPYCGSGTIALEAWASGRNAIANDLNPYAAMLTSAKLLPPRSEKHALDQIAYVDERVRQGGDETTEDLVCKDVARFFHPDTLREILAWCRILSDQRMDFLLAALMGILHHQRPGFLSYPSSHTVPYLRQKLFPRKLFPELYKYRAVRQRLERKIHRTFKRVPPLNHTLFRRCYTKDATIHNPRTPVDVIITSPPYMRQLDYGRDNRLRLWFLGVDDWLGMDQKVTPSEEGFLSMMRTCLSHWHSLLPANGTCVLVLGDNRIRSYDMLLPDVIEHIAVKELRQYRCTWKHKDLIPNIRRVRRGLKGSQSETVLVMRTAH